MDSKGNLIDLKGFDEEEIQRRFDEGYRPVKKKFNPLAQLMLRGNDETKIDKALFPLWTKGSSKKRKKAIGRAMKRK